MAEAIVNAYLEHDKKDYDKSASYFYEVLSNLFTLLPEDRVRKAAQSYVEALRQHDLIEDGGYHREEQTNHRLWKVVNDKLLTMCRYLDLPSTYATETTEFFRHHGVGNSEFISHMLEADKIFTTSLLGHSNYGLILGGLYLACVKCHDLHSEIGMELGKRLMEIYYSILFQNRM